MELGPGLEPPALGRGLLFLLLFATPFAVFGVGMYYHRIMFGSGTAILKADLPSHGDRTLSRSVDLTPEANPMRLVLKTVCRGLSGCSEHLTYDAALQGPDGVFIFRNKGAAYLGPSGGSQRISEDHGLTEFSVRSPGRYVLEVHAELRDPLRNEADVSMAVQIRANVAQVRNSNLIGRRLILAFLASTVAIAFASFLVR